MVVDSVVGITNATSYRHKPRRIKTMLIGGSEDNMSKYENELYKKLSEKEPTRWEMLEYGFALKELAEGVTARSVWEALRHVDAAERHLSEFRGNMVPTLEITEAEANWSASLHTYMRKGMDCPLGTMLYRLIAESKGRPVWFAFVKAVMANSKMKNKKHIYSIAIRAAKDTYHLGNDNTDSLLMVSALSMWEDDFENAFRWVKDDDKEGEAGTA